MMGGERAGLAVRVAGAVMLAGAVGTFAWLGFAPSHLPVPILPASVLPAPVVSAPVIPVERASGNAIMARRGTALHVFRMAENPDILVLDFASLHDQGQMLNRVAAMVEKAGLPHDRVLDDSELAQAIRDKRTDPDTFYYGHDYGAGSLAAFFAAADRQHVVLTRGEEDLRTLLQQEHPRAVISISQPDPAAGVDASMRETIFKHERSHGEYFSNPAYAAFARQFWAGSLTPAQRSGFVRYLAAEDYDPALTDLMINETQAYLMHTRDPRFFDPAAAGLTVAELDRLRALFLLAMPPSWLRDCVTPTGLKRRRRGRPVNRRPPPSPSRS